MDGWPRINGSPLRRQMVRERRGLHVGKRQHSTICASGFNSDPASGYLLVGDRLFRPGQSTRHTLLVILIRVPLPSSIIPAIVIENF